MHPLTKKSQVQIPVNKTKQRLEELEKDKEEVKEEQTKQVEQQVYVDHVQSLHDELINAWEVENNRVKALKIAIRVKFKFISNFLLINKIISAQKFWEIHK